MKASARLVAARVLCRVADDGAYAAPTLDAELSRAHLEPRDAALATEIVYGSLRVMTELDAAITPHVKRPLATADGFTRALLRTATYQLRHLERVPPHGVVSESVNLARAERGDAVSGFVNAVLRKLARERPQTPRPPSCIVVPPWLQQALDDSLGSTRREQLLDARALPPPLCLRVNEHRVTRDALAARLTDHLGSERVQRASLSPLGLLLHRAGDPRALPGYEEGHFAVQEEGAQLIALALDVQPGERVVDACAGRGGKTTYLAGRVGDGRVHAVDLDDRKLDRMVTEFERLGLDPAAVDRTAVDLAVGSGGLTATHDAVLVDAPCTGLGTVVRRPELLLRLGPQDPDRMGALQAAIVTRAAELVRPGGRLLYAVCSPLVQEGPRVASALRSALPGFETDPVTVAGLSCDPDGVLRIGPWSDPQGASAPDGYQVLAFRRAR